MDKRGQMWYTLNSYESITSTRAAEYFRTYSCTEENQAMHLQRIFRQALALLLATAIATAPALPAPARAESLKSAPMANGETRNGMVRVRLSSLGNPSKLNLTVYGSYTVNGQSSRSLGGGTAATVHFNSDTGQLSLTANGITSAMGSSFRLCRHETSGENGIKIAQGRAPGNLYPGDFQFTARASSGKYTLYVIAYIYMEDYLYGVLPYEMGNSSGMEALKAQAVAARTYTMRAMNAAASSLYDVVDTTSDQVYSGTPSGNANCKAAVDATRGIAAKNGSSFTATYYTASNGGQTESIKNAWGTNGYAYLKVKDDPYDLANPDSRKVSFFVNASGAQSNSKLGTLLNQKAAAVFGSGAAVTAVTAVTPHTPKFAAPSRLYTKLDFAVQYLRGGQSGSGVITFDIFGELEGPLSMSITSGSNELWSVTQSASGFTVAARRYGHGIGMSQRGAMYMDRLGYTYDQILAFYFEGCSRVEYTLTRSILSPVVPGQDSQEQIIPVEPAPLETPIPPPSPGLTARVTTAQGSLNLRAQANASARILATIPQYTVIPVLGQSGTWSQVSYQGKTGFVMSQFLTFLQGDATAAPTLPTPAPEPTAPPVPGGLSARVTTAQGSLNLRAQASAGSRVLRTIPQYAVIPVLEQGPLWCKTAYGGFTGYVMTSFLTFLTESQPTPTPVQTQAPAPTAAPLPGGTAARVVTPGGSLNLRASPRDTARVLRTIPQNDMVSLLSRGADWCQVAYGGVTGYVMTRFLSFDGGVPAPVQPQATPAPAPAPSADPAALRPLASPVVGRIISTGGSLNLRDGCSTQARVLREMPRFDFLLVTAVGDTWCAVEYEGQKGYCMTKYLEFDQNAQ